MHPENHRQEGMRGCVYGTEPARQWTRMVHTRVQGQLPPDSRRGAGVHSRGFEVQVVTSLHGDHGDAPSQPSSLCVRRLWRGRCTARGCLPVPGAMGPVVLRVGGHMEAVPLSLHVSGHHGAWVRPREWPAGLQSTSF